MSKNIHFLELSSYTKPEIVEKPNKEWVAYGEDNDYFQYLIDNYNGSPTNNAIINGIVQQIYGGGLDATQTEKVRKAAQWAELKTMVRPDCLQNAILDLKVSGQCSLKVTYEGKRVKSVKHWPVQTLRAEKANNKGEIENYYYLPNWAEHKKKPTLKPKKIPAFGQGAKEEIFYIKPYSIGSFYYSPVDYQGCLPYCDLEQEVANYHINNIQNGLSAGAIINFNNGEPDEKEQIKMEAKIKDKFGGTSNAGKFILAFNDNKESAATIESLQLSEAHAQYEFLSNESTQKIMVGHRVTSPMLLGIKDNTGLGNNAEELKTASLLFEATVINPFRNLLLDALDQILAINGISFKLFFSSLNPFEQDTQEEVQQETTLSDEKEEVKDNRPFLKDSLAEELISALEGVGESEEDLLKDFEMVDTEMVLDEGEEYDIESYLNSREDLATQDGVNLAAQQDSEQDNERYKVRYVYQKGTRKQPKGESRPLCRALINAGRVYRKEDIENLSSKGGAQSKGKEYDVFLYKGGANCYHRWERRVYRKKLNKDGEPWGGGALSGTKKISVNDAIRQGFKLPKNPKEVAVAPIDTPTKGYKK